MSVCFFSPAKRCEYRWRCFTGVVSVLIPCLCLAKWNIWCQTTQTHTETHTGRHAKWLSTSILSHTWWQTQLSVSQTGAHRHTSPPLSDTVSQLLCRDRHRNHLIEFQTMCSVCFSILFPLRGNMLAQPWQQPTAFLWQTCIWEQDCLSALYSPASWTNLIDTALCLFVCVCVCVSTYMWASVEVRQTEQKIKVLFGASPR